LVEAYATRASVGSKARPRRPTNVGRPVVSAHDAPPFTLRWTIESLVARTVAGDEGATATAWLPVKLFAVSTRVQLAPPSSDFNTPGTELAPNEAPAYTTCGVTGSKAMEKNELPVAPAGLTTVHVAAPSTV